jgi:hypothetical protein
MHMSLVRIKLRELESRAATRKAGYVEAFKAAATPDPQSSAHLLINSEILKNLIRRYSNVTVLSSPCCGG